MWKNDFQQPHWPNIYGVDYILMSVKDCCCSWSLVKWFSAFFFFFRKTHFSFLLSVCLGQILGNMCISVWTLLSFHYYFLNRSVKIFVNVIVPLSLTFVSFLVSILFVSPSFFLFIIAFLFKNMLSNKMFFPKPCCCCDFLSKEIRDFPFS